MYDIEQIHESLVNGQRRQMVKQMQEYDQCDLWKDYSNYLKMVYCDIDSCYQYLEDAVVSYHRIINR